MILFYWAVEYLATWVEIVAGFLFCDAFLKKNDDTENIRYLYASTILAVIATMIYNVELFSAFNTGLMFGIIWLVQWRWRRAHPLRTFGIVLSYYAVIFLVDLTVASMVASQLETSVSELFHEFSDGRVVGALCSKAILLIVCITLRRLWNRRYPFHTTAAVLVSVASAGIILLSAAIYFMQAQSVSESTNRFMMLFSIVTLALILTIYIFVMNSMELQQKKQELELIEERNHALEHSLTDLEHAFGMWRSSIHDYKNTILAMNTLIKQGRQEELQTYLDREIEHFENQIEYIRVGNRTVETVLNAKLSAARNQGIPFTVNATMPGNCRISDMHLAAVLGNLLDNAIEAETREMAPYIHVQIQAVKDFLMIQVTNRCTKAELDGKTWKADRHMHGIGLKSVERIARQYGGDFSLELQDGQVTATVMLQIE